MSDYLAVISTSFGGGSFARGPDKEDTIRRVIKIFKSDWNTMVKVKGTTRFIYVIDVEGHDEVVWDDRGFFSRDGKIDRPIEKIVHTY